MNYFIQILCFLSILIVGCGDDYNFPNVNVNESVPITMPQYNNVYGNLWGYEFINGGLGGIIIVQGLDNEFFAYDRACTYEANENWWEEWSTKAQEADNLLVFFVPEVGLGSASNTETASASNTSGIAFINE